MAAVRRYHPFGVPLTVGGPLLSGPDRRVGTACGAALARFPSAVSLRGCPASTGYEPLVGPMPPPLGPGAPLTVTVGAVPGRGRWPETSLHTCPGGLTLRCGDAEMVVDHGAGTATVDLTEDLLACPDALRCFVEGAASSLLIGTGRIHAVHAGLVVTPSGRGVLLRGPSGAGKSTLAYACLRSRFGLCSDDWVYGLAGVRPDRLAGYPWRLFLVADAAARFAELTGVRAVAHPGADRWKVPVEPPVAARRRATRVDAVVLLDPAPVLGLDRIDPLEAAARFWGPALPTERRDLPEAWVAALLDRPCYVLRRGADPVAAAALLRSTTWG